MVSQKDLSNLEAKINFKKDIVIKDLEDLNLREKIENWVNTEEVFLVKDLVNGNFEVNVTKDIVYSKVESRFEVNRIDKMIPQKNWGSWEV